MKLTIFVGGGEAALTDKVIFLASLCSRDQSSDNDILSANYIRFRTVDRIIQTLDATMTPS